MNDAYVAPSSQSRCDIKSMRIANHLLVVSHVCHYRSSGQLYAYGPYAREIDIWADLFDEVRIAAPLRAEVPPSDTLAFTRSNISAVPQPETGGMTFRAKVRQVALLPAIVASLAREMRGADVVHVRCPGNLGLVGALLAPLFSRRRIAKYAGQWGHYPGEAFTVRLQRAILQSRWWGAPVTVYGEWPGQAPHVVPFFTSILSEEHIEVARISAAAKRLTKPAEILFVGRLSASKNVDVLLRSIQSMRKQICDVRLTVIGDGPERVPLERLSRDLGIADKVAFTGGIQFESVLDHYQRAHLLVLVSETEGWPKAIAEAMAFGLVCVGSDRGAVPWLLGERRGATVPAGDVDALAVAVQDIISDPARYEAMSTAAAAWSQQFTLEGLREALRRLMTDWWGTELKLRSL